MRGGTAMDIRRRSLFKIAAGGALLITGGSLFTAENGILWSRWHQFRHRIAMSAYPVKNRDISSRQQDRETILYSRSKQADILKLNTMAGHIWEMCDGSHRVNDIIGIITGRFDIATSECTRDVLFTISSLQQRGLIHS
jgi:hypothetical protein